MMLVVTLQRGWPKTLKVLRSRKVLILGVLTGLLISINWLTYVWSVTAGYLLDASLGYFITPIFSIFLGVFILGERLRSMQWLAVAIAISGVCYFTYQYGQIPWVALLLAVTFSCYGLFRKIAHVGAIDGFLLESSAMIIPAFAYLWHLEVQSLGVASSVSAYTFFLLMCSGPLTVLPICLFTYGAQRCQLTTIGMLQFLSPTMQFCLAVFLYQELFGQTHQIFFAVIFLAVVLYNCDLYSNHRSKSKATALMLDE